MTEKLAEKYREAAMRGGGQVTAITPTPERGPTAYFGVNVQVSPKMRNDRGREVTDENYVWGDMTGLINLAEIAADPNRMTAEEWNAIIASQGEVEK